MFDIIVKVEIIHITTKSLSPIEHTGSKAN